MIPNFQKIMFQVIDFRDRSLGNPHELYVGDTETLATTAGAILQTNGENPRIEIRDRAEVEALMFDAGPGLSLQRATAFFACRISLEDFDRSSIRSSETFWIRFSGNTRLTRARWVYEELTPDETSLTIYLATEERF